MSPPVDGYDRGTFRTKAWPQPVRREAYSSLALCFLPLALFSSPYALHQQSLDVSRFTNYAFALRRWARIANRSALKRMNPSASFWR